MSALASLRFDNRFVQQLPADTDTRNLPRQVTGAAWSAVTPKRAPAPQLVSYSPEVAELLGLSAEDCTSETFVEAFVGNQLLPGMEPYAMCYGGHQFGHWAGQLGDGRAINLGEVVNDRGEHLTLQLKGAGPTPYSRRADGLAVLRSSVREYLCSEAMHHLGVPTTRALSLILTGEQVTRDMFYDGNPELEPGAVVCRVAPSFMRFGSFEIFAAREDHTLLRQLLDFTLKADFPELLPESGEPVAATYVAWLAEVARRTAELMAHWMRVGFVHGVMNTDNLSVLGQTIDYGPYGWLEGYDPGWTPNTTDAQGKRYSYGAQPNIALWNLVRLANAIYPLVGEAKPLEEALGIYSETYGQCRARDMAAKLGFSQFIEADGPLVEDLLALLQMTETDMTIFFRALSDIDLTAAAEASDETLITPLLAAYYQPPDNKIIAATGQWLRRYIARSQQNLAEPGESNSTRRTRMHSVSPKYVLRNYLAQQAIDKAEAGDF
ncbi:MAG TPA: YdiU family protein, partial [Cellvibrionaceae bacterium]